MVKLPVGVVSLPPLRRPGRHLLSADSGRQVTRHVFLNLDNSLRCCWKTLLVGRTFSSIGQLRGPLLPIFRTAHGVRGNRLGYGCVLCTLPSSAGNRITASLG